MRLRILLSGLFALALSARANAQVPGGGVSPVPPITANHCTKWISPYQIGDAGAVCGTSTATGANPTATIGAAAVNGSASTFLRSDGAPALGVANATTLGGVKPDGTTITNSTGAISVTYGTGANTAAQGNDSRFTTPTFSGVITQTGGATPTPSSNGVFGYGSTFGQYIAGTGSASDVSLANSAGSLAFEINHGLTTFTWPGYLSCSAFITNGGGTLSGTCVSARRFKNVKAPISPTYGATALAKLEPGIWSYKDQKKYGAGVRVSLYADDVAKMDSRCAMFDSKGKVVNYLDRCIDTYIVAAWQADHTVLLKLQAANSKLEKRLSNLEARRK